MKRRHLISFAFVVLAAGVTLGLLSLTETDTAATPGCTARDLNGTYAFAVHGNDEYGASLGVVGTFTGDGDGTIDGSLVRNIGGVRSGPVAFACSYTMTPSCSFSGPCHDLGSSEDTTMDGVLGDHGNQVQLLVSPLPVAAGGTATGSAVKQ